VLGSIVAFIIDKNFLAAAAYCLAGAVLGFIGLIHGEQVGWNVGGQIALGYLFPNALLQHAIEDLEALSIDVPTLQARRDRLVPALRELGYETTFPEGTFYVMAKSPIDDDVAFGELLADEGVLVLPGRIVEVPGWFRISLTATDEMVEQSIPRFARARERALTAQPVR